MAKKVHQNIKIVEDRFEGAVIESGEGSGGPFKGNRAGEHGPEGKKENGGQGPELVASFS